MEKSFMDLVATDLYKKMGDKLADCVVVFPNNRARLFFGEALFRAGGGKPIWSPSYTTISDLIHNEVSLSIVDPLKLILELFKSFQEVSPSKETFDEFYYWGEILLGDFDDIDKNLVDASQLFTNAGDLDEMEHGWDFLDDEQREAVIKFFHHFEPGKSTELKDQFTNTWNKLTKVYHHFREQLESQGIAYEGMIYRKAVDKLKKGTSDSLHFDKYVFVGFNVLNRAEMSFFRLLDEQGKALFYWDYDLFYLENSRHEAALFLRKNLENFKNQLPPDYFNRFRVEQKKITYIAATTENAQARYLPTWIEDLKKEGLFVPAHSAVILCNESLLMPVLNSVPESVKEINVTMGFPLPQTPICHFVEALIALRQKGYDIANDRYRYTFVSTLLRHSYVQMLSQEATATDKGLIDSNRFMPSREELQRDPFLTILFKKVVPSPIGVTRWILELLTAIAQKLAEIERNGETLDDLYRESLFRTYTIFNRLLSLLETEEIGMTMGIFERLVKQMLSKTTIPFNGEPVRGMQIMGVLETRNLDFDNLLMMSVNEGLLPKGGNDSSFIPYMLRKAFGMTTIEHKNALFAYYFFRVIQRATHMTMMYNTSSDGLNRGEQSRFLLQLLSESGIKIEQKVIEPSLTPLHDKIISVEKTNAMIEQLMKRKYYSPTALNCFIDCSLKFYFRYIARLNPEDEVSEDIDNATFGLLFHKAAELLYNDIMKRKKLVEKIDLAYFLELRPKIEELVDQAFKSEYFKEQTLTKAQQYTGRQLINRKVIVDFVINMLKLDSKLTPFTMLAQELKVYEPFEFITPSGRVKVNIGGTIDRIDQKDNTIRIVDYKTGGSPKSINEVAELFVASDKRSGYIFQAFLYSMILKRNYPNNPIAPHLLYIHQASVEQYSSAIHVGKVEVTDIDNYYTEMRKGLDDMMNSMFNQSEPFTQTDCKENCLYCDFKTICRR